MQKQGVGGKWLDVYFGPRYKIFGLGFCGEIFTADVRVICDSILEDEKLGQHQSSQIF